MSRWIALLEVQVQEYPAAYEYYANCDKPFATQFYEPLIDSIGSFSRGLPLLPGPMQISTVQVVLNNSFGYFSTLLGTYSLQGRTAALKIGKDTDALSAFRTIYTGEIADVSLPGNQCVIVIKDIISICLQEEYPGAFDSSSFPSIAGTVDPDTGLVTGAIEILVDKPPVPFGNPKGVPCQYVGVDTDGKHQYLASQIPTVVDEVYVLGGTPETTPTTAVDAVTGQTFILFDEDQEALNSSGGITVKADLKGACVNDNVVTPVVITNPVQALRYWLEHLAPFESTDSDETSYTAAYNSAAAAITGGLKICGIIAEHLTHEQVLAWFATNFGIGLYQTRGKKFGYHFYQHSENPSAPRLLPGDPIIAESLQGQYPFNQEFNTNVINQIAAHHSWDPINQKWGKDLTPIDNVASQDLLGATKAEGLELQLVGDDATADYVSKVRLFLSDQDRPLVNFGVSGPLMCASPLDAVDIGTLTRLNHYLGINSSGAGYVDEPFMILSEQWNLNAGPTAILRGYKMEPSALTGYKYYDDLPANVELVGITETDAEITVTWNNPVVNPPRWIWVYYKKSTETAWRYHSFVEAADETFTFFPWFALNEESADLNICLRPEDLNGVTREIADSTQGTIIAVNRTTMTAITDLAAVNTASGVLLTWSVPGGYGLRNFWVTRSSTNAPASAPVIAYDVKTGSYLDTEPLTGETNYYAIYSLTNGGKKSLPSNVAALIVDIVPGDIPHFLVEAVGDLFIATWGPPKNDSISPIAVVSASNESPIEIETASPHHFADGDYAVGIDIGGNSGANFWSPIKVIDATHILMENLRGTGACTPNTGWVHKLVGLGDIRDFVIAYSVNEWDAYHDADDPEDDPANGNYVIRVPVGAITYKTGNQADSAFYWAIKAILWDDTESAWTYQAAQVSSTDVPTFPSMSGEGISVEFGGSGANLNQDSFTASGGETYIQLAALADLSKAMIVAFAVCGGTMGVLRKTAQYTASNTSGYTRITILNADGSPYTFVGASEGRPADIADILSTPA